MCLTGLLGQQNKQTLDFLDCKDFALFAIQLLLGGFAQLRAHNVLFFSNKMLNLRYNCIYTENKPLPDKKFFFLAIVHTEIGAQIHCFGLLEKKM